MVSLVHPDEYPMNEGQIGSTGGVPLDVTEYEHEFAEQQVPHSTALQASERAPTRRISLALWPG